MCYKILFLCILFVINVTARTELSKAECPSMFSLSKANVTTISKQQSRAAASKFFSIYDNEYLNQSVQSIVINGDSSSLNKFISNRMTFYIILIVIFSAIFITAGICCTFQHSCPPKIIRRDLKKRPYTVWQFRIVSMLSVMLAVGIIVPCLMAFSYIPRLKKNVQLTKCSLYIVLDATLNGEKDTGWGGFNNLYTKIQNVTQYLTQSLPNMNSYLNGDEWLIQEMQTLKQMNLNIYSNNKDARLYTPNPTTTKQALDNGLPYPMIGSRFVTKGLGPNGTVNTLVTDVDRSLRTTQVLSSLAYGIEVAARRVIDSSTTLLTNTNSSLQNMEMYIFQLQTLSNTMNQFKSSYIDSLFHKLLGLLQASFGIEIIGGFCTLLGVIAAYKYEIFKCKSLVSLAWTLFGFGFIGSMIVVFATLGVGSLGYGFCNYFDTMISSQAQFSKLGQGDNQNPFSKLDSCFFSDGNVLQKFNLGSEMGTVTNLFQLIKTYYDYQNQLSTNYIDKNISTAKITSWMSTIQNYKQGIYTDFDETITTDDNPNYAINRLNLYTKGGAGVPVCAKDRWVFDKANCTYLNETVYTADTADNGVALQTSNQSICVSFNQKISILMNNHWSSSDFTNRYKKTRQSCPDAYQKILDYGYAIIRFRDSRINLFQGIQDELNSLYAKNILFNTKITQFNDRIAAFEASASDLNNVVSNTIDGLLVTADCRYIVDSIKFTYNMLCVNVMYDVTRIGWCAVIVAVLSILAMIVTFLFSVWFGDVQRNNKWFEDGYSGEDYVDEMEMSSVEVIIPIETPYVNDIGIDFQKLGQFTSNYVAISKIDKEKEKQQKTIQKVNSDDSSEEQNPYVKQILQ